MIKRRNARVEKAVKGWLRIAVVAVIIILGMVAATHVAGSDTAKSLVGRFGYIGVFIIAVISGFNLVVPVPAVAFIPVFIVAGLNLWVVIIIISVGMTTADTLAFLLGRTGRSVLESQNSVAIKRLERFREKGRNTPLVVMFFYASFAPLPNEVLAVPLGFMGYRVREIVLPLLAGNLLFNTLAATGIIGVYGVL